MRNTNKKLNEINQNHDQEMKSQRKKIKEIENMDISQYSPSKAAKEEPHFADLMENIYELKQALQNDFEDQLDDLKQEMEIQKGKNQQKITQDNNKKIEALKDEYSKKLKRERERREKELNTVLKRLEELEKQKADAEIQKFKKTQKERIEEELSKVSNSNKKYETLKKEYTKKLQIEQKRIEEEIYKLEYEKYQGELEALKSNLEQEDTLQKKEIDKYKQQLEEELQEKIQEVQADNNYKIEQEKIKLDRNNQQELDQFEDKLKEELEDYIENLQKTHEIALQNEDREFEILKLKQDQFYEEELERRKRDINFKYRQQMEELEEEKTRKTVELEASLREMSLSKDNPDLSIRIQKALQQQKDLEQEIDEFNNELIEAKNKRKRISADIIEANKDLIQREKDKTNDRNTRIAKLRDKIDQVDDEIVQAEQEYQRLLDQNKNIEDDDSFDESDLNERVAFDDDSGHPNQMKADNSTQDISDIKTLIEDTGIGKTKVKDYLLDVENYRKKAEDAKEVSFQDDNIYLLRDQVRSEKAAIKKQQRQIERDKNKWREDKLLLESNPELVTDEK